MADKQAKKKGRRKIPMERIENDEDRLITFSKRRAGIYKKATEIGTLCNAEVGVLIFSPAGKPFAYGVPNIESISRRLMSRGAGDYVDFGDGVMEAFRRAKVEDLNKSCDSLSAELQRVKKEGDVLAEEMKEKLKESGEEGECWWWDVPVEDLKADEMQQVTMTMEEMNRSARNRLRDLFSAAASSSSSSTANVVNEIAMAPGVFGGAPAAPAFPDPNAFGFSYGNA